MTDWQAAWAVLALLLVYVGLFFVAVMPEWLERKREVRRQAMERELERAEAEMRATILNLASQLGAGAHEARRALIRESYLASRRVPPQE